MSSVWKLLILACALVFCACSDNKSVASYTESIATNAPIVIKFNTPIANENDVGQIQSHTDKDGAIFLNGKPMVGHYAFQSPYELLLAPFGSADAPTLLAPDSAYAIEVKLGKLTHSLLSDTLKLDVKTKPTQASASNFMPSYIDDKHFMFQVDISLSQPLHNELMAGQRVESQGADSKNEDSKNFSKALANAVSLTNSKGEAIAFAFTPNHNQSFSIQSSTLPLGAEETYTLTLRAKAWGLAKDESFKYVRVKEGMELSDISAISSSTPQIQIAFSQALGDNPNLDNFISISPHIKAHISTSGNLITLSAPFSLSQKYEVRVKEGIKGIDGSLLEKSSSKELVFSEITPQLVFSQSGVFLPSNAQKKIAFKSINVKKVKLKVSRIYPNNITAYLYKQNLIGDIAHNDNSSSDDYDEGYYGDGGIYADFERLGDVVFEREYSLDSVKNQWIQSQLDFSTLKDSEKSESGIYIVELSFDEKGVDYSFPQDTSEWRKEQFFRSKGVIQKHLIFSNIALIAQRAGHTLEVQALDIATNTPLPQVQVLAISHKNQVLAQKTTNEQGRVSLESDKVMYLSAHRGKDTTILRLNAPLSLEGFDVGGLMPQGSVNTYIYTDRGVYRPGERAELNIIARADSKPITHPVFLTLISPRGKVKFEDMEVKDNIYGLFHAQIPFDKGADTGLWRLKVKVGDSEFWHNIAVESVVPNRIKASIESSASIEDFDETLPFGISASYLFGAPAAGLRYEASSFVQSVRFSAPAYSDYTFSNPTSLQYSSSDKVEGSLDENGAMQGGFEVADVGTPNANLRASINAKVYENGGRYVNARKNVDIILYKSFVGIKAPARYVRADSPISLPLIVLDSKTKKPLANHKLNYKIYQNSYSWWWDYDDYNSFTRSIKQDRNTKLIKQGTLSSREKPSLLEFSAPQGGELFIEVEDEESGSSSGVYLYASENGEPSLAPKLTQLKIESDKPSYTAGEEAIISFESVAGGRALVSIISGTQVIKRLSLETKANTTSFTLPIESRYAPNIYASVHLLQDYKNLSNDRSQRLFGALPIMVEDKDSKLSLNIESPASLRPNESFEVKLSNKENKQVAYSLAIVDEGLLGLTDFASPNPWKHFYQKLALMLTQFDNYDLIIGRDMGKIHQILKVGGDEAAALGGSRKDLRQAERFKPVVLYSAPVKSDEEGRASFSFTMPPYMGSVRIMAVAVNERALGAADREMKVSAPVVMLPTIPRSLKVGDEFELAIELIPTQDKVGKVKLKMTSGDKIKLEKNEAVLNFENKKPQILTFKAKVSDTRMGVDSIAIALESSDFKMEEKTDIDILPNNPYTTISKKFILKPGEKATLETPSNALQDSAQSYVLVSNKPIMSIDHRLRWLIRYPYGCIEQTTSSALPQLFLSELSNASFIDKTEIVKNINAAIARIGGFQTSDGGFAYWQGGTRSDSWGSAYAGHFLLLAKERGYYVPESVMKRWLAYEVSFVKSEDTPSHILYPLYLLSLAKQPQVGILNHIYESYFKSLSTSEKWLLAAAYKLAGMEDIATKITTNLKAKGEKREDSYYRYSYGSTLRDDAMILQAYIDVNKRVEKPLFEAILQDLESAEWYSTQTLGYSLLALASATQAGAAESSAESSALEFSLNGKAYKADSTLKLPFSAQKAALEAKTPLFANLVWDGIVLEKQPKARAEKIALTRSFLDEKGNEIDPQSLPQGSSFYIKLTLNNASREVSVDNVAITQNLPSGWEVENTRLNNDELPEFARMGEVDYMDIRDDSVMWFLGFNGRARSVLVKVNTITPGRYLLPPAQAEAMYDHSFLASTTALPVEVKAREGK